MKFKKVEEAIGRGKTILGVGPMSDLCIEAVCEVANEQEIPIMMIASRRQVECDALGGGICLYHRRACKKSKRDR